jgi:zona occludens toxin (predicted ATPase)
MTELYLPLVDVNQRIVPPAAVQRADAAVEVDTRHLTPFNMIERLLLPALGKAATRFAYGQSSVDLARVAIALERYRLVHGEYPETLDALEPRFIEKLPHDVINGEPLHYRRTGDGQFVLYSVGWNETDDDGEVGLKKDGSVDRDTGDWVWRYPAR